METAIIKVGDAEIRTVYVNGEARYVAKDVAAVIGYKDTVNSIKTHCKNAKPLKEISDPTTNAMGLDPQTKVIPEKDVYRLVFGSRMPNSKLILDSILEKFGLMGDVIDALKVFEVPEDLPDMYIYAIREKDTGNIKIGISRNPSERLAQLQTGNSSELEIVMTKRADNRFKDEKQIHDLAAEHRVRGEWFRGKAISAVA